MRFLLLPTIEYRKKCQLLAIFCLVVIVIIFVRGWRLGVVESVTDRLRFRAIPIAVSVLYHNHPHDYTGIREVALPFQHPGASLQLLLKDAVHKEIKQRDNYYWVADDKGYLDYVIVAFKLFGPKLYSLYWLWFVCLTFSVGLFLKSFSGSLSSLALLSMTLVGIHAAISILPLADEANFRSLQPNGVLSSVSIYEPRFLDVLAMIPVIHICLFALRRTWPPNAFQVIGLLGQMAFFILLYHARSSLGWQILAIATVSVLTILLGQLRGKQPNTNRFKRLASPALVITLLIFGISALSMYQKAHYNPRYYEDMGVRTFWHNALMGLGDSEFIKATYGLDYGDYEVATVVVKFAAHGECAKGVDILKPAELLNSLGGHGEQDWYSYESCAKKFYASLWGSHTLEMLRVYLITKPKAALSVLLHTIWDSHQPISDGVRDRLNIGWYPFSGLNFVLAVIVLCIASTAIYRKRIQTLALLTILLVTSLIPSISFYSAILTMGGFFVTITVLCQVLSLMVFRWFIHWLYAETVK